MTNTQKAQDTRNVSVCECLTIPANAAIFASDVAFSAIATKMIGDTALAVAAGSAAAADNTGYSMDKVIAKDAVGAMAAQMCDRCIVKLNLLGNHAIAKSLNGAETFYSKAADALCVSRLTNVHTIMTNNLALITADYLTAARLAILLTGITNFSTMRGSTVSVNDNSPVLTNAYATAMKLTSADVVIIKSLIKSYKLSHPLFYASMMKACKMPGITVRHTTVVFTITDAATGAVLPSVAGTLTKSKELPVSNISGIMTYTTVPAGSALGTFAKTGYVTATMPVEIKRGSTTNYAVELFSGVMTAEDKEAVNATIAQAKANEKAATEANKKAKKDAKALEAKAVLAKEVTEAVDSVIVPAVEVVAVPASVESKKTTAKIKPTETVVVPPAEG